MDWNKDQNMFGCDCWPLIANSGTFLNGLCSWTIESVRACKRVLQKPGFTVFWQSALMSCSSWLSNFSRDGWREMVSLLRVKGSILSSWGLSRASPGDSTDTNISAMPWHLHDYIILTVLLGLKWVFFSPGLFSAQQVCSVGITVKEKTTENHHLAQKTCETSCVNIFHHTLYTIFVTHLQSSLTFPHRPQKIYLGIPEVVET